MLIVFILPLSVSAQEQIDLKRKYFGKYQGTIPSYKMGSSLDVIDVGETAIYVTIAKDEIAVTIGNRKLYGTYEVMFMAKKYYLLDAKIKGQLANERILVYKRGRRISRDGLYPQPVTELNKFK